MAKPNKLDVTHPTSGETAQITVPADHDGSRVKVEFPDGATAYTDGWDPAERALVGERPVVPCGTCGTPQVLTREAFDCAACGARNTVALITADDSATVIDAVAEEG